MKNWICLWVLATCLVSCAQENNMEEEFIVSGFVYKDCAKAPITNTNIEVVQTGLGLGGQKTKTLATGKTAADGSFSMTYKAARSEKQIGISIPANDALQLYSPIGLGGIDPAKNNIGISLYMNARTDVKVRLKCGKTYTNQDTLYINQPASGVWTKIVAPQTDMILDWKGGYPGSTGSNYGIGWAELQKSIKSGSSYPQVDYNILRFSYPTCENSPMEIVLNLP